MHSAIVFAVLAVAAASPAQAQLRLSTNTTERVVASRIVRGEPSAPSITVTSARDDDGRAIVSARCAREVEQTIVEDVEVTTAGFWPVYAGITVLGSVGVVGGGVAAAMASSDPTADPFNVAMGATAAGVGALGILVGGVGLLGSLPATTTEKRERAGDPVTEPCSSALLRIEGGRWADEAVTDYAGEVTFEMPSEIQHAKVEVVDERGGAPDVSASVEAPPGRPRRSNSAALEAESDTEAAASKTPLPAVGLNAATAPPLVCPDGAHVEGGRPPAATTEVCKRPDGKKEGGFRQWADDGSLKLEGQYRDDAADGPWQGWHPNGERQFVGAYADGKWSGVWNYWGPDGQRKADVTYRDGRDVSAEVTADAARVAEAAAEADRVAGALRAATDLKQRRAAAVAAWRGAKAKTAATIEGIGKRYGDDAIPDEAVEAMEKLAAQAEARRATIPQREVYERLFPGDEGPLILGPENLTAYEAVALGDVVHLACDVLTAEYGARCTEAIAGGDYSRADEVRRLRADLELAKVLRRWTELLAARTALLPHAGPRCVAYKQWRLRGEMCITYGGDTFQIPIGWTEAAPASSWSKCQQTDFHGPATGGVAMGTTSLLSWLEIPNGGTVAVVEVRGASRDLAARLEAEIGRSLFVRWKWHGLPRKKTFTGEVAVVGGQQYISTNTWLVPQAPAVQIVDGGGDVLWERRGR